MTKTFIDNATEILLNTWSLINSHANKGTVRTYIKDHDIKTCINLAINSKTKSYRYVLPTQIVAKLADNNLDCRCIQVARGGKGAFDARTIAHKVIVPFDQSNDNVLGGSPEPYVNNPLRIPEISSGYREAQKNQKDWDHLCKVLNFVETKNENKITVMVFKQVLLEVFLRLSKSKVAYPAPTRISLKSCIDLMGKFLEDISGGDRLLTLSSALFVVIGKKFKLYSEVKREKITSSDKSSGMVSDLECLDDKGAIVLAVEVKDRVLTVTQMKSKIPGFREKKVTEILFVAQQGIVYEEEKEIIDMIEHEFNIGQNVYITHFNSLSSVVLAIMGEEGRRDFINEVGIQLDRYSDYSHRKSWADLLKEL